MWDCINIVFLPICFCGFILALRLVYFAIYTSETILSPKIKFAIQVHTLIINLADPTAVINTAVPSLLKHFLLLTCVILCFKRNLITFLNLPAVSCPVLPCNIGIPQAPS